MATDELLDLLDSALPGHPLPAAKLVKTRAAIPGHTSFRRHTSGDYAVFYVTGDRISTIQKSSIAQCEANELIPVLVAHPYRAVSTIAPLFNQLGAYVICEIGGVGRLIPPPNFLTRHVSTADSKTRVPRALIQELARSEGMPARLVADLSALADEYLVIEGLPTPHDANEEQSLLAYASKQLESIGLPTNVAAPTMLRRLESSGVVATRDHFFHSFQNYFLGLATIATFPAEWLQFRERAKLHWDIDPFHVWFLTVMWHDVGYSVQKIRGVIDAAAGFNLPEETSARVKRDVLAQARSNGSMMKLASLMYRLLHPEKAITEWAQPTTTLTSEEQAIERAIESNVDGSHGAIGALRLCSDFTAAIDRLSGGDGAIARQTMLLAAASMPFHDMWFRKAIRKECGDCKIDPRVMPFASLLAFVDSLQDDRRDIESSLAHGPVNLAINTMAPRTVAATLDPNAIDPGAVLHKIIEAWDVTVCLITNPGALVFEYPSWAQLIE